MLDVKINFRVIRVASPPICNTVHSKFLAQAGIMTLFSLLNKLLYLLNVARKVYSLMARYGNNTLKNTPYNGRVIDHMVCIFSLLTQQLNIIPKI